MDVMLPDPAPIRAYMRRYNLSQRAFGELIDASQSAVSQWLCGKAKMSGPTAKRIEERTGGAIKRKKLLPRLFGSAA